MRLHLTLLLAVVTAVGCVQTKKLIHSKKKLPPAVQMMEPGPGVGGPGPGVMQPIGPGSGHAQQMGGASQVAFIGPPGMHAQWDVAGTGTFDSEPLVAPARYNFQQGAIYRLKITNLPDRPGLELYPTLEVGPALPRTVAYLAHNAIPVQFTPEDLDQVATGNFVTKVIYLPDPEFQELAIAGVETLVSTRLDPGVDPIVEADRRGAIMAVVRLGNKDLEVPGGQEVIGGDFAGGGVGPGAPLGPQYGMPMTGTPIGLPGPPHVPLGTPAGLQQHTIRNWTHYHLPPPTEKMRVDVREKPGYAYPKPVSRMHVIEHGHGGAH